MSKKRRKKRHRHPSSSNHSSIPVGSISWQDEAGIHFLVPGLSPSADEVAKMTQIYQDQIRKSPLWQEMVKQFGLAKAEELLKECQVKIKPGHC